MNNPLDEACDVLDEFDQEIAKVKAIWEQLAEDNPHFEQVSPKNWQEKHHRMWLHGATDVWECNELERWLYGDLPATKIAERVFGIQSNYLIDFFHLSEYLARASTTCCKEGVIKSFRLYF